MWSGTPYSHHASSHPIPGCECPVCSGKGLAPAGMCWAQTSNSCPRAGFRLAQGFLKWRLRTSCSLTGKPVSNADSQPQAKAQVAACSQHREQAESGSETQPGLDRAISQAKVPRGRAGPAASDRFLPTSDSFSGQMTQAFCWASGSRGLVPSTFTHPQPPQQREKSLGILQELRALPQTLVCLGCWDVKNTWIWPPLPAPPHCELSSSWAAEDGPSGPNEGKKRGK